jgi:hypothetical protein
MTISAQKNLIYAKQKSETNIPDKWIISMKRSNRSASVELLSCVLNNFDRSEK